jgi:hypothetical protein
MLVCNCLHSVGQNHFYVMMHLNSDSAIQRTSRRFCTSTSQRNRIPNSRLDNVIYRPDTQLSKASLVRTENDKNFPSGPSSVSRSFELLQLASVQTFQQYVRTTLSVQPAMGFPSKTQLWEDRCNRPDDVDSHLDALIHKASIAFKI